MRIIQPEAHILPFNGDVLKHVERCGRIAYKSEDAITEDSHVRFIQNIIQRGHESVLEHGNCIFRLKEHIFFNFLDIYVNLDVSNKEAKEKGYTKRLRYTMDYGRFIVSGNIRAWRDFIRLCNLDGKTVPVWVNAAFCKNPAMTDLIPGSWRGNFERIENRNELTVKEADIHWTETCHFICDRTISHELVRHRALSPTQESQRYCNYAKGKFGSEITFIEPLWATDDLAGSVWRESCDKSDLDYMLLIQQGLQPQQARKVLTNSAKTELVMTGTLGEWKHFFSLRCADDADPEMRRIAIPLREEFNHEV